MRSTDLKAKLPPGTLAVTVGDKNTAPDRHQEICRWAPTAWLAIDSIVRDGIARKAFPGCEVLAVQNGEIKYHKAFGNYEFDSRSKPVTLESIYDLASVTKVSATTRCGNEIV